MRVLYVIDSLAPGGAEMSLLQMSHGLVNSGIDLHVLPLGERRDLEDGLRERGVSVHHRGAGTGRLKNVEEVIHLARRVEPKVIHTTLFESGLAGRAASQVLRIPTSTSSVGDTYGPHRRGVSPMKLRVLKAIDTISSRGVTRFHAVSRSIADTLVTDLGIPRDRIDVIPRGRPGSEFSLRTKESQHEARQALGVTPEALLIVTVGRLEPVKGFERLLAALPMVARGQPDVLVLMAGMDGAASAELHASTRRDGMNVRFLGQVDDVRPLLTAADVLCFPSRSEGSPGAVIEAMAVGCPIVGSDIPPIRELLHDETDVLAGRIVDVEQPEVLATAILEVSSRPAETERMAELSRARFMTHYEIDKVVARMSEFLRRVVDEGVRGMLW